MKHINLFQLLCPIVILFSFVCVIYMLQYSVLIQHDNNIIFNRTFFEPEHGRFFSTFVSSLFAQRLPEFFKIHPCDFRIYASIFKAFCVVLLCVLFSFSAFVFSKKKINEIFFSPSFIIIYLTVFLCLFNGNFYFADYFNRYLNVLENMVFFEYPMSMLTYIPFFCIIFYSVINKKMDHKHFICLIPLTFLVGLTIEMQNIPIMMSLTFIMIYLSVLRIKRRNIADFKKYILIYLIFVVSFICYYLHPADSQINYPNGFESYFKEDFAIFYKLFCNLFLYNIRQLLIPLSLIYILILFYTENKNNTVKFVAFSVINILSLYIYLFSSFFMGEEFEKIFYFQNEKWFLPVKLVLLFYLILAAGYFLYNNKIISKYASTVKIILCLTLLAFFHQNLVTEYFDNINKERSDLKAFREQMYKSEKYAMEQKSVTLCLPAKFEDLCLYYDSCYPHYFENVHPPLKVEKIIFTDDYKYGNIFTEEELEKLRFTDLYKIHIDPYYEP